MTCGSNDIKELLPLYRARELEEPERKLVEEHLQSCRDCRTELLLLEMMAEEAVPDPGEAFWAAMPDRVYRDVLIRHSQPQRTVFSALWQGQFTPRWAWASAAVTIVVVLSWLLVRPAQKDVAVAVLPADESSYEEVLSDGSVDVASLTPDQVETLGTWVKTEYAAITAEAGSVMEDRTYTDIYKELAEMDNAALERFSTMIDTLKKEGQS
jgi:hypothetical protein